MRHALLLLVLLLLPGCGEVPDVHPFTKATTDMGVAVHGSLKQVARDLRKTGALQSLSAENKQALRADQLLLDSLAARFGKVAHAFDGYAKAVDEVAVAGEKRAVAIKKVTDATDKIVAASQSLAAAIPVASPYAAALGPVVKGLAEAANTLNQVQTTNRLLKLALPEQEAVIERTTQLLSAVLAQFAQIDAGAYTLLADNDAAQDNAMLIAGERRKMEDAATYLLRRILQAETILLRNPPRYGGLSNGQSGPLDDIIKLDKDPGQAVAKAFAAFKTDPANPAKQGLLARALSEREGHYDKRIAAFQTAQAGAGAAQARWEISYTTPKRQSEALLQKSQQLLETWADSHHALRLALLKAHRVSAQDLLTQAQKVQQLIAAVKAAQETAAISTDKAIQTSKTP